ncbi:hypothetical protein glysoja_043652 [Glycine soja]|uniref:Dirigent protein n=1 Tax=Glycine soja TaxID=3848 RepID=A0A0B2QY65_GLYSO|nr:hypothetical protein glysoja_043652 [Glycine soja]
MAPQFLILSLLISCQALTSTTKAAEDTGFVGSLDRATLGLEKKNQVSHFRFYFHETFTANNATSVPVVPALPKYNTTTSFGTVGVMDNALTTGPERSSKLVGRVEGLYAATSQTEFNLSGFADGVQPVGGFELRVDRREVQWQHHHDLGEEPHISES